MAMLEEYCKACGIEADAEVFEIDKLEDAIGPLDNETAKIRQLISSLELCYHEADKEAEYIAEAIGAGQCPPRSNERPAQRKKELENCRQILSSWCENPAVSNIDSELGGTSADELLSYIGKATPLKAWQIQRVLDKVVAALDRSRPYHNIVLDLGPYGEPGANPVGDHYKDNLDFVKKTVDTVIHDTVDGQKAEISLAMAIDMLEPCNWDFVGSVITILKVIGGETRPARPYACHQRNLELSPLRDRLKTISNTLSVFWKTEDKTENIDENVLASLGKITPVKRWLAASLDKTIRLYLEISSSFWLKTFS